MKYKARLLNSDSVEFSSDLSFDDLQRLIQCGGTIYSEESGILISAKYIVYVYTVEDGKE